VRTMTLTGVAVKGARSGAKASGHISVSSRSGVGNANLKRRQQPMESKSDMIKWL